jgi:hypothetical protein
MRKEYYPQERSMLDFKRSPSELVGVWREIGPEPKLEPNKNKHV